MQEKQRHPRERGGPGPQGLGNVFDGDGSSQSVTVTHGPYAEDLPVSGYSIEQVRVRFRDRLDIDPESQAMLDGTPVRDDTVVRAGQVLAFIRRAGEKGVQTSRQGVLDLARSRRRAALKQRTAEYTIVLKGEEATLHSPEGDKTSMDLETFLRRIFPPQPNTGSVGCPDGLRGVFSRGPVTVVAHESSPRIWNLKWIAADSSSDFGKGTTYRNVRIALPYLIVLAVFVQDKGRLVLSPSNECFFALEPVRRSAKSQLYYPGLLNCSKFKDPEEQPLSWICTQHLNLGRLAAIEDPTDRVLESIEALHHCLTETGFNLSSEHHEETSWFTLSTERDERISTIERWEEETEKDPVFPLDIPWIPVEMTVAQVVERIFDRMSAKLPSTKTASSVARLALSEDAPDSQFLRDLIGGMEL